jgi:hypothetical protein
LSQSRSEELREKKYKRIKTRGPIKTGSYTSYVLPESYIKININERKQRENKKIKRGRNITEYLAAQLVFPAASCSHK